MKWKSSKPKDGTWRVKTKFALFPVRTTLPDKETIIWLERYQTNDKYVTSRNGSVGGWLTMQTAPMGYWSKNGKENSKNI